MHGLWQGRIALRDGQSRLVASNHRAPLKVAKAFAAASGEVSIIVMDSSPGLFHGDVQEMHVTVEEGASVRLTTQSACKVHPTPSLDDGVVRQAFHVAREGWLEYFPESVIPFRNTRFHSTTDVYMERDGQALMGDILSPGRVGHGERFAYASVWTKFRVYWDGVLTAVDTLRMQPDVVDCERMFGGHTHMGTMWALSSKVTDGDLGWVRDLMAEHPVYGGCSLLTNQGCVIRWLGGSAWEVQAVMQQLRTLMRDRLRTHA